MMLKTNSSAAVALYIPPALTLTVTREQFIELAIANRDLQLERTATGELIVNPPTGGETGNRNSDLNGQLWLWNRRTRLGKTFDSSTGFHLPSGADRYAGSWLKLGRNRVVAKIYFSVLNPRKTRFLKFDRPQKET